MEIRLSEETPFECSIDGIELSGQPLYMLHRFYEASCTAEYVMDIRCDITGVQAMKVGYAVRERMDKYGCDEDEAIAATLDEMKLGKWSVESDEEPEAPDI